MGKEIVPEKQSVMDCLQKKSYYVDFYQRDYVWSKSTVEVLLRDIFYAFELSYNEHKHEDMSPEVLSKYNWYYLNVFITNEVGGKVYIVDGQQRLTTLTLIATKLYHISNNENLKDVLKECIYAKDPFKGNIFCIDNDKRKNIMECILNNKEYDTPYKNKTEETLVARYNDISKYLEDKKMDDHKLNAFTYYFLYRLVLVELSIQKDDTPMVFEVINDRGEALKPFEILKGKLIGALSKSETEEYSNKWDAALSGLTELTKNGIALPEDSFFADYLKAKYVFKRNAQLEKTINNSYHRYIYEDNDIANSLKFRNKDYGHIENIKHFIDNDLSYYSRLYSSIRKNNEEFLRYDYNINGLAGQYQNIMAACDINDSQEKEKVIIIAKEFDRLWTLLILNGVYESNEFQGIYYNLNEILKTAKIDDYRGIFNQMILQAIKDRRNVTTDVPLLDYSNFIRRGYSSLSTRFMRYFYARIDNYICTSTNQQMQNDIEYISTRTGNKTGYHIEHILSNNKTNMSYFSSEDEFNEYRNQLGGLMLLKGLDNISIGNEEYQDRLATYNNGLMWGRTLCKDVYDSVDFKRFNETLKVKTGICFKPYAVFDKDALEERNVLLYNLVKIIWEA